MTSIQARTGFLYKENCFKIVTEKRSGYRHCQSKIIPKRTINNLYYRPLYGTPEPDMVANEGQKLYVFSYAYLNVTTGKLFFSSPAIMQAININAIITTQTINYLNILIECRKFKNGG